MKAIVKHYLSHPTRSGRSAIETIFHGDTKEVCENQVNNFIFERCNKENYIPVTKFEVAISKRNGDIVKSWNYIPTHISEKG